MALLISRQEHGPWMQKLGIKASIPSTWIYGILRTRSRRTVINRNNEFEMTNKTENTGSHAADQLLTIQGLASRAQVAAVTVRRWIMAGQAPAHIRVGRIIRFRLQDVKDWEDERARSADNLRRWRQRQRAKTENN
jgi:excisionase family DNA binding protein